MSQPAKKAKTKSTATAAKSSNVWTEEERAAMKERAKELKAEERANKSRAEGEKQLLAAISKLPEPDKGLGKRIHAIVKANAPDLLPKTWYGMPAYADKEGKVVCFFQPASKFKARYGTFGFNDTANLDDGNLWPVAFALTEIGAAEEAKLAALVKKAVS